MGVYLNRYWQSDGEGMNKAERMGGLYRPYLPDTLADYELLLSPSCASAVADAQEALGKLELSGSRIDTEPLARMMLRTEAVSSSRIEGLEMPAGRLLEYEELVSASIIVLIAQRPRFLATFIPLSKDLRARTQIVLSRLMPYANSIGCFSQTRDLRTGAGSFAPSKIGLEGIESIPWVLCMCLPNLKSCLSLWRTLLPL